MYHFSRAFLISTIIVIFIAGCDIVDEPYLQPAGTIKPPPDTGDIIRKVLLEDFTGHKCPNCPEAADLVRNQLKPVFGAQLIVISVHAGNFAEPSATGEFTADYRTSVGNDLNSYFSIPGYPTGMVNRTPYKGSTVLFTGSWQGALQAQVDLPVQANIVISNQYNSSTRELTCTLESTFFETLSGTFNICVYLTESGIISAQQNESQVDPDYEHNHMLRASLNGTWGELVGEDGLAVADIELTDVFSITLDNGWNAGNCHVVAFIYNNDTKEILQAEEAGVTE